VAPDEPIRADLGRPETPEERAARKAENSRNYRGSKTANNLVIALVVSLAVVLATVLVVVRPDPTATSESINYSQVAAEAQGGVTTPLIVPTLPPDWTSNRADLTRASDESFTWYIGFLNPDTQYIALEQGINTTPGWFSDTLKDVEQTGTTTIEGIDWKVYNDRATNPTGNFAYSLAATVGGSDIVLHGTASEGSFEVLASAVAGELEGTS